MYAIDLAFSKYEAELTHERQDVAFAGDLANLGLTGAIPLVGAGQTKNVLGAVASGLTGVRTSYNDDIILNRTIQILQDQMEATRARISVQIIAKLSSRSTSIYTLAMALSDLEDYYKAGTLTGALLDVSSNVSQDAAEAQIEKSSAIPAPLQPLVSSSEPLPVIAPNNPSSNGGSNDFEQRLGELRIRGFQHLLCLSIQSGSFDKTTRLAIAEFLKGYASIHPAFAAQADAFSSNGLTRSTVRVLDHAVSVAADPNMKICEAPTLNTPFKIGRNVQ